MAVQKDCYPFIFTNIKGPILVKEEDMDAYIRSHEDDFIGQAEESLPIKSCRRLFELFNIDTDCLDRSASILGAAAYRLICSSASCHWLSAVECNCGLIDKQSRLQEQG